MKCPKCQTEVAAGVSFCPRCGAKQPRMEGASVGDRRTLSRVPQSLGDQPTVREPRTQRFRSGDMVLGRYRVLGELGQGGMGVVYRCLDEVGGIEVALKALPPELSHNSAEMEEVRENFQLVSKLVHQHIAAVKTLERDQANGDYYLILELAEGVDLRKWRKQRTAQANLEEALPILRSVAEALDYAHRQKIIHRDIKPSNVIVRPDGTVKVLDFGLAAQIQSSLSRVSQAHYGTSGTGPYMAPEQWRGQRQDGATDQYALAVMAYELLSGQLPFDAQDPVVLKHAVLDNAPERPEGLSDRVWGALSRGLAKQREGRCGNCAELVAAMGGQELPPPARVKAQPSAGTGRGLRTGLLLALAAGVVLAALGGWYFRVELPRQRAAEARRVAAEAAQAAGEKARAAEEAARAAERERQAKIKAEADAYAALGASKTEEALKAFLTAHLDGAHFAKAKAEYEGLVAERQRKQAEREAKVKAEADAYAALGVSKTEEPLKGFMEKYPDGAHFAEAREAYDKLVAERQARVKAELAAYEARQVNPSEAGLKAFLATYPDGAHAKSAKDELAKLEQERIRHEAEAKAREEARKQAEAEEAAWQQARDSNTEAALRDFVGGYPKNAHVPEAQRMMETLVWQQAVKEDKAAAYADFAQRFPNSSHAEEANKTMAKLQRYEALLKNISGKWIMTVKGLSSGSQTLSIQHTNETLRFHFTQGVYPCTAKGTYKNGNLSFRTNPLGVLPFTYTGQLTKEGVIEGKVALSPGFIMTKIE